MPHTLAALEAGELSEWRSQIITRETATLTPEQRTLVDAEVIGSTDEPIGALGDRELARRVRAVAYRIDAASVMARAATAEADRRVTIRPAPDTMAYLTALLPAAQAIAAHAALTTAADTARAAGDQRGKGQVMADTLVARITGQDAADAVPARGPARHDRPGPVRRRRDTRPAHRLRHRPRPVGARPPHPTTHTPPRRHRVGPDRSGERVAARLFTHPATGTLVAMDSTRRTFDGGLRRYLLTRDAGTCRTPWCDAPARHLDHIHDHADGGPTTDTNGQGLCVRCNHTKQLPGFTATTITDQQPGAPHTVRTTTPTGHTYTSHAPPLLPGLLPRRQLTTALSPFERALTLALAA